MRQKIAGHPPRTGQDFFQELADYCQEAEVDFDHYGKGKFLNAFETEFAELTGMEAALFLPSGVMAQLIAVRIWADQSSNNKFACHESCHLIRHEEQAYKYLHNLEAIMLGEKDRVPLQDDLQKVLPEISSVVYEVPMRHLGGDAPEFSDFESMKTLAKSAAVRFHVDGARLFELLPFWQVSLKQSLQNVDSAFFSFYKGFGSTSGSMLVGNQEFIKEAKVWLRRHGGNLFQMNALAVPAKVNFAKRVGHYPAYFEKANEIAKALREKLNIEIIPNQIKSNMFHLMLPVRKEKLIAYTDELKDININLGFWGENAEGKTISEFSVGDASMALSEDAYVEIFGQLLNKLK